MAAAACYHCGLPVAASGRWSGEVLGAAREFCCAGCLAVARTIVAGGAESYYATRTASAARPAEVVPATAYDDPQAQAQFAYAAGSDPAEPGLGATLILDRIRCAACLWLAERTLRGAPGVRRAHVNYATRRAEVVWDPRRARVSDIVAALRAVGYDAWPYDPSRQDALERGAERRALWQLFVAGFGAMQVMMYAFPAYVDDGAGTLTREADGLLRWASLALTLPVIVFSCGPFFTGAWRELARLRPGLDTPIALGIGAGFLASVFATVTGTGAVYFDSIVMLVFLLLGARYLELRARRRSARALDRLARWSPSFALRVAGERTEQIGAHQLKPGERALVPAGERVPADGVIESGASSVDESLLTGESRPLAKRAGAVLVAGSINLEQPLVMRVTRAGANTQAAALARLVERAAAERPRLVAAADRIAHALTYVVLLVALAAAGYWQDVWVAVAVLVATCPCALALSAPIALNSAASLLLERGVALTRAGALETLAAASDVVLDKTGTLTHGRGTLARVQVLGEESEAECRALARALEASSRHPVALALADGGPQRRASGVRNEPGQGVEGRVAGRRLRIGTEAWCRALTEGRLAGPPPALRAAPGATTAFLADERGLLAAFVLRNAVRAEAAAMADALRAEGLRVHLVSGDQPQAVGAVGALLGIGDWRGGASPGEKLAYVERLQREGRIVAMVGDGLNDTPVLARADVSFAMGGGADAAQMHADFVLTGDSLAGIAAARRLARRTMGIVRQNFAWALGYNALALPLAAAGWIGPWEAAVGMAASSFVVVLNAMRVGAAPDSPDAEPKSAGARGVVPT